jgi:hypothetical protein
MTEPKDPTTTVFIELTEKQADLVHVLLNDAISGRQFRFASKEIISSLYGAEAAVRAARNAQQTAKAQAELQPIDQELVNTVLARLTNPEKGSTS